MKLEKAGNMTCLRVNQREALAFIESLCSQMLANSPNSGRYEGRLEDGKWFTIAVVNDQSARC